MIVVGLTGGVGTGKSTVARLLATHGAVVLDADALAHEALEPERPPARAIGRLFGRDIVNADRTINRAKLGRRVFASAAARRRLEAIVHPYVYRRIRQDLRRLRRDGARVVVLDVPLLLETGGRTLADVVVVVTATPAVQRRRLKARGWSAREVAQRRRAQWALSRKIALADAVVENSNGLDNTRRQVNRLWKQLREASRKPRGSIWPR